MNNIKETKLQCEESCIHAQVCGHKTEWANYCKEHIKLREKSILFDEEPKCRYYIHESRLKENELVTKVNKDDYAWHFDNDKRKAYEQLAKPYSKNSENVKNEKIISEVKKISDEELIKILERFLGI